jgi:GNAT superfamily N-acetyltransferase
MAADRLTATMSRIVEIDPHAAAALHTWYGVMRAGAAAGRAAPQIVSHESLRASLVNPNPHLPRTPYGAFDGGTLVGALLVELPRRDNTHTAELDVNVPPENRNRGVGAALLAHGERLVAAAGRTVVTGETYAADDDGSGDEAPGLRFGRRHGYESAHQEDHLLLDLPAVVPPAPLADGYELVSWLGACPADVVDAFAAMRSALERDLPIGELDLEPPEWDAELIRSGERRMAEQGYAMITTAARHADGTFAGYSQLLVPEHDPGEVHQEDTLVMREYRGHRLGAAVKAANLAILADRYPERRRVHTWTDGTNGAMQHINAAFGFRRVEVLHELQRRL